MGATTWLWDVSATDDPRPYKGRSKTVRVEADSREEAGRLGLASLPPEYKHKLSVRQRVQVAKGAEHGS